MPFILYLEVCGEVRHSIDEYFRETRAKLGATEAHQYHPHCSITGFFEWPLEEKEKLVEMFVDCFNSTKRDEKPVLGELSHCLTAVSNPLLAKNTPNGDPIRTVRISISCPKWIFSFAGSFKLKAESKSVVRIKPIDHISLAYIMSYPVVSVLGDIVVCKTKKTQSCLDAQQATPVFRFESSKYYNEAQKLINLNAGKSWDIVLYEKEDSGILSVPHKLTELYRIPL